MVPSCSNLLIVDDDTLSRYLLEHVLEGMGNLFFAETAREALELFHKYNIDIIICDVHLPDMSFVELLKEFKNIRSGVPLVVHTGDIYPPDGYSSFIEMGAVAFIEKPISFQKLRESVINNL